MSATHTCSTCNGELAKAMLRWSTPEQIAHFYVHAASDRQALLVALNLLDEVIGDAAQHGYDNEHQERIGRAIFSARAAIAKAEGDQS